MHDTELVGARREFHFEWDGAKAQSNGRKHGVAFALALSIFRRHQGYSIGPVVNDLFRSDIEAFRAPGQS